MSEKIMLPLADLGVLAETAKRNGTEHALSAVFFQWAEKANSELERQAKEISSLVQAVADHVTVRSEQFAEIAKLRAVAKEMAEACWKVKTYLGQQQQEWLMEALAHWKELGV